MEMTMLKTNGFTELNQVEMENANGGNKYIHAIFDFITGATKQWEIADRGASKYVQDLDHTTATQGQIATAETYLARPRG